MVNNLEVDRNHFQHPFMSKISLSLNLVHAPENSNIVPGSRQIQHEISVSGGSLECSSWGSCGRTPYGSLSGFEVQRYKMHGHSSPKPHPLLWHEL